MGDMTLMQEMTGVRLFNEEDIVLIDEEIREFKGNLDLEILHNADKKRTKKEVCEIYFDSEVIPDNQTEQFMLSVEQKGKKKSFLLKRKNEVGKYKSEKAVKISHEQYRNILTGSLDWMRESKKILINEFYCKMKLFQYKISKIIKCQREEIYFKCEEILLSISENMKIYYAKNTFLNVNELNKKAYIKIRSSVQRNYICEEPELIRKLISKN
ncbi:MAG: hypothetical protein PHS74_03885 [Lachnospiraceae bacterium]|nr:hypothetical protein [Lachnospiraceae bacterium]